MEVIVIKHTDIREAHACIESTMGADFIAKSTLRQIYSWEHSITRSQIFSVQLIDVPTFVSVHISRHVTTVPFVRSKRIDRDGDGTENRFTPVNHRFIANAESLLHIARRRLCYQASPETRDVVLKIREEISYIDPDLAYYMVPNCVYRGGICPEPKPCGHYIVKRFNGVDDEKAMRIGGGSCCVDFEEEGLVYDDCVWDQEEPQDCDHAKKGIKKEDCKHWR